MARMWLKSDMSGRHRLEKDGRGEERTVPSAPASFWDENVHEGKQHVVQNLDKQVSLVWRRGFSLWWMTLMHVLWG